MLIKELQDIVREHGIVGAGGAGFPSYAKMTDKADTIILNCVECEPLLKLNRQLIERHTKEIVTALDEVRKTLGAKEAVIGIKKTHKSAVESLDMVLKDFPCVRVCPVSASYPMGDEVVLIYEATGRTIKPGGIPIDENVIVYNVETMFNIHAAVFRDIPVVNKLVSIAGAVENPITVRVPIGMSIDDAVALAGKITCDEHAFLIGGPMMGYSGSGSEVIKKTTNAIIVLPMSHKLITGMNKNLEIEKKRASSACCQCRTCTDLCPRHSIGHPIEPHRIMRAVANSDTSDLSVFKNAAYCSGCGLCEKYSCPQGLSPRSIIAQFKSGLRAAGIKPEKLEPGTVDSGREYKKVPADRLKQRLDLMKYDHPTSYAGSYLETNRVSIPLNEHIGIPAVPIVKKGDKVKENMMIAKASDGLSVAYHASIDGVVESVSDNEIVIKA